MVQRSIGQKRMQMIEAVIKPSRLEQVKEALARYGILGVTAVECKGIGREIGRIGHYRGNSSTLDAIPKVLLRICVRDYDAAPAIEAIRSAGRTGYVGDGKVFVFPVSQVMRIRTGERDEAAL
jgi:nitrogen regulatory protein PII